MPTSGMHVRIVGNDGVSFREFIQTWTHRQKVSEKITDVKIKFANNEVGYFEACRMIDVIINKDMTETKPETFSKRVHEKEETPGGIQL